MCPLVLSKRSAKQPAFGQEQEDHLMMTRQSSYTRSAITNAGNKSRPTHALDIRILSRTSLPAHNLL